MAGGKKISKVTVNLPEELLKRAKRSTGLGTTETIRQGLQLVAASQAYAHLASKRGKIRFSVDLARLRDEEE